MTRPKLLVSAVAATLLTAVFSSAYAQGPGNILTAIKVAQAPKLDGNDDDAAWKNAKSISVKLKDGENFNNGATTVTLKAVYSGDMLYMLVKYDDPTNSHRRSPYVKQADGSWKKLTDPDDKGGDNNKYYEDKWAMIWNINNSIKEFKTRGCDAACHAGQKGKPFGNKYTESPGETGDIWHMKSVRSGSVGQIDDQFLDDTRFDKEKSPEAGRKSDPKTGGGYTDVKLVNGKPEFMGKSGKAANKGGTYWLLESDKTPFDDSKFVAGDEVASIMVAPFTGDRGEIAYASSYKDGKHTGELSRKLVTGSKFDVQFDKLDGVYDFGFAAFDNAQVRHAVHSGSLHLKFAK
ncbi:MAG: ethylbenzene dehydrogenase-related protein [Betaproteobacteria bacterium]